MRRTYTAMITLVDDEYKDHFEVSVEFDPPLPDDVESISLPMMELISYVNMPDDMEEQDGGAESYNYGEDTY